MSSEESPHIPKRRCIRRLHFSDESVSSDDSSSSREHVQLRELQLHFTQMAKKRKEPSYVSTEDLDTARDLVLSLSSNRIRSTAGTLEKIWIACVLSEISGVVKDPQLYVQKQLIILKFIVKQLEKLKSEEIEIYNACVTLMKSLAETNILCLCFSSGQSDDIESFLIRVFDTMFLSVRYDKNWNFKEYIFEVLYQLCYKMAKDRFPAKCMDIVLCHFLSEKVNDAFLLAYKVIDSIPAFVQSLNRVLNLRLHSGPSAENDFVANVAVFNLIEKLHKLIPKSVTTVLGSLELCLASENNEEKLNAFQLLTYLYTEGNCEEKHVFLWKAFLKRLQMDPLGQKFGLAHASDFLIKKPHLRKDLDGLLRFYSAVPDVSFREEVVNEIVRSSFYYSTYSEMIIISDPYLVDIVAYRRYDVNPSVRHAALYGLAEIYEHCSRHQQVTLHTNLELTTKMTWLLELVLEVITKETSSWQDKTAVRYLLYNKMLPTGVSTIEKMKYFINMWNVANAECETMFHSVENFSSQIRNHMETLLLNINNGVEWKQLHFISEYFDEPERSYNCLKDAIRYLVQNNGLEHLWNLLDISVSCEERMKAKEDLHAMMDNEKHETRKLFWKLLVWIHDDIIDRETIKVLLSFIIERASKDVQTSKYITLLHEILFVYPQLGFTESVTNVLVSVNDVWCLKIIKMLSKHKKFENVSRELYEQKITPIFLQNIKADLKRSKLSLQCVLRHSVDEISTCEHLMQKILHLKEEDYIKYLKLTGCLFAEIPTNIDFLDGLITLNEVKKIIVTPVIGDSLMGIWCVKSALGLQTLKKIVAIESFVKCLLAKFSQDDIDEFYVLLSSIAAGRLTIDGLNSSSTEISWLRLTAGCSILKLCTSKFFWQKLKLLQFKSLATLLYDADECVTDAFLEKMTFLISNNKCPVDFFSLYAFIGMDMQMDKRRDLKSLFFNTLHGHWQHVQRYYRIHEEHVSFEVFINTHQNMLPESSIVALVCLLASSWKIKSNLAKKCLEFFFSVILHKKFAGIRPQKEYYLELLEIISKSKVLDISDIQSDLFNSRAKNICDMAKVLIEKMWLIGSETYQVVPDFPRRYFHPLQESETVAEIR